MDAEEFLEEMLNRIKALSKDINETIHWHTPVSDVEFNPYRINIDTGCFNTGKLSCLVIDEDKIDILNS